MKYGAPLSHFHLNFGNLSKLGCNMGLHIAATHAMDSVL